VIEAEATALTQAQAGSVEMIGIRNHYSNAAAQVDFAHMW
jgi:hypothetical protein